jgi:hypothetical protein
VFRMKSLDDLWNHIAYVLACAPNDFPAEDFLSPDEQMTLDRAFEQLRDGIGLAYPAGEFTEKRTSLNALLDRSYAAYRRGESVQAGHLLNEFQNSIFKRED